MLQPCLLILLFLVETNIAVPLTSGNIRVKRDGDSLESNSTIELDGCTLDDVFYKSGQEVPSLGPCESCVCKGSEVVCAMVKCQPNSGCRILQQSGQCCPLYKCDCEYNGQVYNNGERLDKPEDPCQVCYCKGGEIMCTSITCYERDDCQPHFSPGQCCPKYDHCPVESSRVSGNSVRSVNASLYSPKREMQPWPLTKPTNTLSSINYEESSGTINNVYPQTIKIVEILPTTPGYANKPGEVSVIPRLKTNEQQNEDESKEEEFIIKDENTFYPSTTSPESSTTVFASSTSEIEHLMETTVSVSAENGEQRIETVPERAISTVNPLSEVLTRTNAPDPQPDSQRFSTVYPTHFSENINNNSVEETTFESSTDAEGSGYEILTGGIYEDHTPEQSGDYSSEVYENPNNTTNNSMEVEYLIVNGTNNVPKFEAFTATESNENLDSSSPSVGSTEANETSVEVFDSLTNDTKGNLDAASLSSSENSSSSESEEDEESSTHYLINNHNGTTPNDAESTTEDKLSSTSELYNTEDSSPSGSHSNVIYSTSKPEFTSVLIGGESTTTSDVDLIQSTFSTNPKEDYEIVKDFTQTTEDIESSTYSSDPITTSEAYSLAPTEGRKKTSRLTNQNVATDSSASPEEHSTLMSFPTVLNVNTLGYNGTDPKTEIVRQENATTMAKVGIYHPGRDNELAGFLTIVDDKSNPSTTSSKLTSAPLLLTPNDLKKLAEILIHEKIKPANLDEQHLSTTSNVDISETTELSGDSLRATTDSISENEKEEVMTSPASYKSSTETTASESESDESLSQDEIIRNIVSTTSSSVVDTSKDVSNEDSNTSRQIRIPDSSDQLYTTPLDPRDLIILENFIRKNTGWQ